VAFGAWLRRRDTALLRILGQSSRGTRATMLAQSALITLTATVVGVVLGTAYGWIGAQSVFGVEARGAMVVPVVPVLLLAGLGVAAAVLTVLASLVPIRASLRLPPITAYTS
jgi:putative ABC transport system permease protein